MVNYNIFISSHQKIAAYLVTWLWDSKCDVSNRHLDHENLLGDIFNHNFSLS